MESQEEIIKRLEADKQRLTTNIEKYRIDVIDLLAVFEENRREIAKLKRENDRLRAELARHQPKDAV